METVNLNTIEENNQSLDLARGYLQDLKSLSGRIKSKPLGSALLNLFEILSNFNEKNKEFVLNFFKEYESIYEDAASAFENPDCSCRRRFSEYMENNPDISENVFSSLLLFLDKAEVEQVVSILKRHVDHFTTLSKDESSQNPEQKIEKEIAPKDGGPSTVTFLAGKSFIIGKEPEDYSLFFKNLVKNRAKYNGLSIAEYDRNNIIVAFY